MKDIQPIHWFACILFVLMPAISILPVPAVARGVQGRQKVSYTATEPINTYQNAGYRLTANSSGELIVSVNVLPLRYAATYPMMETDPETTEYVNLDFQLPPHKLPDKLRMRLTETESYWYAVSAVLSWVHQHFSYDESGLGPYSGDCDTAARTTVQLLRLAGIPAREAVGLVMDRNSKIVAGTSLHRFVEIYYPDLGWLFSDPLSSHHFVPASYIRLDESELNMALGLQITRRKPLPLLQPVGILNENPIPNRVNLLRYF